MIDALYFDGTSARAHPVRATLGGGRLRIDGEGIALDVPARGVRWPERARYGGRVAHLPDGGVLQGLDNAAWDAWARDGGLHDGWVVRLQQNWRATVVALGLLVVTGIAGYLWGVPWVAGGIVAVVPASADRALGERVLESLDRQVLQPSRLPAQRQAAVAAAFDAAVRAAAERGQPIPAYTLRFRSLGQPNAFALPGGTMVMTDELVTMLADQEDALVGVLGHELGHVQGRHAMRQLVQAGLIAAATSVAIGDFSSWLAAAPALLGAQGYARDLEREADEAAIALLRASGRSPAAMVVFFDRVAERRAQRERDPERAEGRSAATEALVEALSSHPADAERVARFRDAARH